MSLDAELAVIKICTLCGCERPDDACLCPVDQGELFSVPRDPLAGTALADRYETVCLLGIGGVSVVYKARHKLMDRLVAVKMLHSYILDEPLSIQRFQQEAQTASRLSHPNIVQVFDFGLLAEGQPYLVMDLVEGESLESELDRSGVIVPDRVVSIVTQVCDALAHAHRVGVLHRDLKPGNIMLTRQGEQNDVVKILDFGMATFLRGAGRRPAQKLTQECEVAGTPFYMSPEQCRALELDPRSDIYSLGCVMYHALAGHPPFAGENALDTMRQHVLEMPRSLKIANPDHNFPTALEELVMKALKKKPEERYQSMEEMKRDLQALASARARTASVQIQIPEDQAKQYSILIVEDLPDLRRSAARLVREKIPGSVRIYEASNGQEGLRLFDSVKPDLVIMDVSMPEMSGIKAAQQIWKSQPTARILFWSQYHRETYIRELGRIVPDEAIHGYALKSESDEKFAYAIVSVLLYDNPYIDPIVRAVQKRIQTTKQALTDEEYETLVDIVAGLSDRAIAMRRHISIRGVQSRMHMLEWKLLPPENPVLKDDRNVVAYDFRNRLIFEALRRHLIDPADVESIDYGLNEWLEEEFDYELQQ